MQDQIKREHSEDCTRNFYEGFHAYTSGLNKIINTVNDEFLRVHNNLHRGKRFLIVSKCINYTGASKGE